MRGQTYDKEKVQVNLARLKKGGREFEIVVDPDLAIKYRKNQAELREVLKSENVFHDAKKGELASEEAMKSIFSTANPLEVAETIIKEGEIQLTAEHREKLRTQKKNKVLDIIHKYSVDPRNSTPHPRKRLENAMREAKVSIDEHSPAEDQVQAIVKQMMPILPIKFEIKEIQIHLSGEHAAKLYGAVQQFGQILKEDWLDDGSWMGVVEIPGGMEADLYDKLNSETHGEVETKIIKTR